MVLGFDVVRPRTFGDIVFTEDSGYQAVIVTMSPTLSSNLSMVFLSALFDYNYHEFRLQLMSR